MSSGDNDVLSRINKIIDKYLENFIGPKQGSDEWYTAREVTIGGSEMSTLLGINPFNTLYNLVGRKIGIKANDWSVKMQWGNLFEPLIMKYTEYEFDTVIKGHDVFITGVYPGQSYSPDGLGVVNLTFVKEVLVDCAPDDSLGVPKKEFKDIEYNSHAIALFEFKCPYSRLPRNKIPEYYIPQVLTGLDTIQISDIGIYAEAQFRRCTLNQLDYSPEYSRKYTPRDLKTRKYTPLDIGFVIFKLADVNYYTEIISEYSEYGYELLDFKKHAYQSPFDDSDLCTGSSLNIDIPDFGEAEQELFEYIMNLYHQRIITPLYSFVSIPSSIEDIKRRYDELMKGEEERQSVICGILPWKLLKVDYNYVEKQIGYVQSHLDKIQSITELIKKCKEDPDNKISHFSNHFRPIFDIEE